MKKQSRLLKKSWALLILTVLAIETIAIAQQQKCAKPNVGGVCTGSYTSGAAPGYDAGNPCNKQSEGTVTCYTTKASGSPPNVTIACEIAGVRDSDSCGNSGNVPASYNVVNNQFCNNPGQSDDCCFLQQNQPCVTVTYGATCNTTSPTCNMGCSNGTLSNNNKYDTCVKGDAPPNAVLLSTASYSSPCK